MKYMVKFGRVNGNKSQPGTCNDTTKSWVQFERKHISFYARQFNGMELSEETSRKASAFS